MDMKQIGARIQARREKLGLSRAFMAEQLDLSLTGYGYYETGRREIGATTLAQIAQLLRCPIAYLYGEYANEALEDDEAISHYRGIPPHLKPAARAVLKAMFEQADREETTHGPKAE